MKINKPVIIVLGEPNSTFTEILSKVLNNQTIKKSIKYPIILIGSKMLVISQLKKLGKKLKFETLEKDKINNYNLKKKIYLIDIKYNFRKPFEKFQINLKIILLNVFKLLLLLNAKFGKILINGPVSKQHFLQNFPGITEYVFKNTKKRYRKIL